MKKRITNDKYYNHLEENEELLFKSGWFDDNQTLQQRLSYYDKCEYITPIHKLKKPKTNNPIVLLTTGGFSPMHLGHLELMNVSKSKLEDEGFEVVGGYFSPSHDNYVLNKHNKTFNIENRIISIEKIIHDTEYMSCLWESVVNDYSINFTDVIDRMTKFLQKVYHKNVKVCYVFGSDNQYFMQAFAKQGMCVCVKRDLNLANINKILVDNTRIFTVNDNNFKELKSRNINYDIIPRIGSIAVRKDVNEDKFDKLLILLKKYYKNIIILPKRYPISEENLISMDIFNKGDYNIELTRKFYLSSCYKSNELIPRENSESIENQIKSIPEGEYVLIDDDISSGFSINYLKNRLKNNNIIINKEISLMNNYTKESIYDVVDARDFFFGEKFAGLTVELPNKQIARVPYIYPFIDLNMRASMSYVQSKEFSKEIIELNKIFNVGKISELPKIQQELFYFFNIHSECNINDAIDQLYK